MATVALPPELGGVGGLANMPGVQMAQAALDASLPSSTPKVASNNANAGTQTPAATGASASGSGSSSGGIYNPNYPQYLQGIQQEYGATINAAPTTQNLETQQENLGIKNANDSAQAQIGQQNAQSAVLGTQANATQAQEQLSLAQLAQMIRGQYAGLNAQLGSVGAGSSSATGMGAQGLAQEQNSQRAGVQQQATGTLAQIQAQQGAVGANINAINQWKQNQISTIQNNYGSLINQLSQAVQQAQGEEKARLAEYGQTLTDTANAALTQIEKTAPGQVQNSLTQGAAAEGNLQNIQTQFNPINVPTISPFSTTAGNNNGNATANPTGGSLQSLLQQQSSQPLA